VRCACAGVLAAVLMFAAGGAHAAGGPPPGALEAYRSAGQKLLHDEIAPRLRRAAPSAGAPPDVDVVVTASRDPLDLMVEMDGAGSRRLVVSAGFLLFLDSLIDAEVAARLLKREAALPAYRDDIVRYAGVATRARPDVPNPGRFFRRLGLTKADYDALLASRAYQDSHSNNMVQSLAWIAAHRFTVGANTGRSAGASDADRPAARWAWAAEFAPFPLPGPAMLYFAALDPSVSDAARLRCRAQQALNGSLDETRAARTVPGRLFRPVSDAQLNRWVEMTAGTAPAGSCDDAGGVAK
jgi:hypothetical protein